MVQTMKNLSATSRRLLAVLAAMLMLIGVMAGPLSGVMHTLAEDKPTVSIGEFTVAPGETFEVPIMVSNNPGIISLAFKLGYDASALELVGKADGDFGGTYSYSKPLDVNPYVINWMDPLAEDNITNNSALVTLTFKVKEDAPAGDYALTYDYKANNIFNYDEDIVEFTFVPGTVTVTGAGEETPCAHEYDDAFDADCNLCGETREVVALPDTPYVAIGSYAVKAGDTFEVPVMVGNNPGIISLALI